MRMPLWVLLLGLAFPAWADEALWRKLATEPDLVVFMRHTQPAPGNNPLIWDESGNCKGESMLTPEGEAHAKRIGAAFAAHGIKPKVVSSPMCRCRDTARIAFGPGTTIDAELREISSADSTQRKRFEQKAQSLIAGLRGPLPVVFVNHRPNIDLLTMELVAEGEMLVGRANAGGEIEVLGRMSVP